MGCGVPLQLLKVFPLSVAPLISSLSSSWVVLLNLNSQGLIEVSRWGWWLYWGWGLLGWCWHEDKAGKMQLARWGGKRGWKGLLPRRRSKWLKVLMQMSGRCVMRKAWERWTSRQLSSETGNSGLKSGAVEQFRIPTGIRVLEMSTCQTLLSGDTWTCS